MRNCHEYCEYWTNIAAIADTLSKYDGANLERWSLDEATPLLDAIEDIAQDPKIEFASAKQILDNKQASDALKVIRVFYVAVERRLKMQNASDILEADDQWKRVKAFHYYDRYLILVDSEARLARFSAGDQVAFVGGGSVPLTPMLLSMRHGVKWISRTRPRNRGTG